MDDTYTNNNNKKKQTQNNVPSQICLQNTYSWLIHEKFKAIFASKIERVHCAHFRHKCQIKLKNEKHENPQIHTQNAKKRRRNKQITNTTTRKQLYI